MPPKSIRFDQEQRAMVKQLASEGKIAREIAPIFSVTKRMLEYRCREELQAGYAIAKANGVALPGYGTGNGVEGFEFTRDQRLQIQEMAGFGLKNDQIAVIMGCGKMTLIASCQEDLDIGRAKAHHTVTKTLYQMATDGEHPNETKFYLKAQAGWREGMEISYPDEHGNPQRLMPQVVVNHIEIKAIVDMLNEMV